MLLPFPAIDAAFKASTPRDVAVMFLIEDSTQMSLLWPRLRDFYLPKVLTSIKDANPSGSIQVLWMSTSQLSTIDPGQSSGRRSRRWSDIPIFNFIQDPNNKVSPVAVSRAVDALASAFGRTQVVRHLMIIAASDPGNDSASRSYTVPWIPVVHKIHQEDTRLHLIVRSQHNMDGLTSLFWETVKKDSFRPTVTDDTHYVFYLRNEADHSAFSGVAPMSPQVLHSSSASSTSNSSKSVSAANANKPSLVFQLQKLNGMEKKRRSRSRRNPPMTARPGVPYQKSRPETGRETEAGSSRTSSPVRSRRSGRTIDEVVGSVYDAHSRSTSSEDTTSYSATTSPTRSLSPSSPSYSTTNSLTSSPLLDSPIQWPLSNIPSPPAVPWNTPTAYETYHRPVINTTTAADSPTVLSSGYQSGYRANMPVGPVRSHYPASHHANQRRIQPLTSGGGYTEVTEWHHTQRESGGAYAYPHDQPQIFSGSNTPSTHVAAPPDPAYAPHGSNYTPIADEAPAFYSEYDTGAAYCYPPNGYESPTADPNTYSFPMHSSSSSLNPPPVSTFFR